MTNTSESSDDTLKFIRIYIISRTLYLIVFGVGIIGNTFNLIVFSRKKFRANSCSIYFIVYSINNFISLTVGLLLWSLTLGFDLDLEYRITNYCKIRRFFTHVNYLLSSCLLTMASINRYVRVRQAQLTQNRHRYILFCKHRTTYIIIVSIILFSLTVNIHIPIFFRITNGECYAQPGLYRILFDVFFLVFYAICPPALVIAFNIATVINIRSIKKLVHPTISRREYNLIVLVIAHSVTNIIFTLPFSINKFIYYTFADTATTEPKRFANSVTTLILFMNPGFSFFLYTLTTQSFRHEFVRTCKDLWTTIRNVGRCRSKLDTNVRPRGDTIGPILSLPMVSLNKNLHDI